MRRRTLLRLAAGALASGSLAAHARGPRPRTAPAFVLVHGFKFHPEEPAADPHRSLFALRPSGGRRVRSWPEGLGFREDAGESGLCVGFAWPASAPMLGSLLSTGRTGLTTSPGAITLGTTRRC